MGMLGAFLFGYWLGTRAGEEGMNKLRNSTYTMLQSDELKSTVAGMAEMARGVLMQGMETARGSDSSLSRAA